jgi:predicted metal-dependent HD superfamily phosphohydrolase
MQFRKAEQFITEFLKAELPYSLFYHNYQHTIDVLNAVIELAIDENVSEDQLQLLKTAALFHDSGFVKVYHGHEEEGCRFAQQQLPKFDYSQDEIDIICSLIMATKTPQNPQTHLEKILCDADLFYLGTDAFEETGQRLLKEWQERGKINLSEDWDDVQIKFLEAHHYFTESAIAKCNPKKAEHLQKLKERV